MINACPMARGNALVPGVIRLFALAAIASLLLGGTSRSGESHQAADEARTEKLLTNRASGDNWPAFGRLADEQHFSPLTNIDEQTISRLGLAWSFDLPISSSAVSTPIEVDGTLYIATGLSIVRALRAETGELLWSYDSNVPGQPGVALREGWGIRGLAWSKGRILLGTQDGRLICLDANSGNLIWSVQTTTPGDGRYVTGAPRVFEGKVIIGHGGADFAPVRGYVTAYDVQDGKFLWRFYSVPGNPAVDRDQTTQLAANTWKGQWWRNGGGGTVWNSITYDPAFKRIYIGTGNGAPWNQQIRSPGGGDNLFICSVVALDINTGRYVWHYQTTPGDVWDYDSAADMVLADLQIAGKTRHVLLQAPKNGFFYVLDRSNGHLISAQPFTDVTWAKSVDLKTGRPVEQPDSRLSKGSSLLWPGAAGAHSWQPMSFNPIRGLVYIPVTNLPQLYDRRGIDPQTWRFTTGPVFNSGYPPLTNVGGPSPVGKFLSELLAWDPVEQKARWRVPLLGSSNGGVLSTAGNLVFQGRADGQFTAYAADNGHQLWSFDAQNGILAAPITYRIAGVQYISVIAAFGGGAAGSGSIAEQFDWSYRTQRRRVLTFALDSKAALPAADARQNITPVQDSEYQADDALAEQGAIRYATTCLPCHGLMAISGGSAPDLRASPLILDSAGFAAVLDGALSPSGMPDFHEIASAERDALRQYLRRAAKKVTVSPAAP